MSLFSGLFHVLSNPIGMVTDPIGTIIDASIKSHGSDVSLPEDIG